MEEVAKQKADLDEFKKEILTVLSQLVSLSFSLSFSLLRRAPFSIPLRRNHPTSPTTLRAVLLTRSPLLRTAAARLMALEDLCSAVCSLRGGEKKVSTTSILCVLAPLLTIKPFSPGPRSLRRRLSPSSHVSFALLLFFASTSGCCFCRFTLARVFVPAAMIMPLVCTSRRARKRTKHQQRRKEEKG